MRRAFVWLWRNGIVSTFMTGFFVILPFVVTLAIMGWVGSILVSWLGPESLVGRGLESVGVSLVSSESGRVVATVIGWTLVLLGIWFVGLLVKSAARQKMLSGVAAVMDRIPIVNSIYRTVSQVVEMVARKDGGDMSAMSVVYCSFGAEQGGGFLALLASTQKYQFAGRESLAVYIPTSPVPMSGGIVFVPAEKVQWLDMTVDDLMQIYFSLGVMSARVIPEKYRAAGADDAETLPASP